MANKRMTFFFTIICSVFSSAVFAENQHQFSVNFTGNVLESPCTLLNKMQTVDFGNVSKKQVIDRVVSRDFSLGLTDCPHNEPSIRLMGAAGRERVDNPSGNNHAEGVSIAFREELPFLVRAVRSATPMVRLEAEFDDELDLFNSEQPRLHFFSATLVPTDFNDRVGAGKIDATAIFNVEYN